ncbi:hypothetical protein [uncultured Pontibacter sp.]|uniref:hypothetical protein n=1 Tax=uncultured Pontibacter sp. TaxID=453356 RepID=UPI00262F825A|nr:hypothetical protein [uncultured Pontibacter sp.]
MKSIFQILSAILISVALLASGCSATKEQQMEDDLADFRSWVSNATSNVADRTEEDWKRAREDFNMRTQELDQKEDQFTDELKQDYQSLKREFQEADEEYQKNMEEPGIAEWERGLLDRWADFATINENTVRDAYITFMENVRAKKSNWDNQDWEMAKRVLEELNERKDQIEGNIPTETEVKIKALQMEFRTLETAADI